MKISSYPLYFIEKKINVIIITESSSKHSVPNWHIMFYCILGVFGVSLIINGALVKCVHSR